MSRKGMSAIAFLYLVTVLICFLPFYHFRYSILLIPALMYALPFVVIGWGLMRRRGWGRKLAILTSVIVILTVGPLLLKRKLTVVFPFPFLMSVTYPPDAAVPFKTLLGTLVGGHLFCLIYLVRRSAKEWFN
jgi:hypothetical protein